MGFGKMLSEGFIETVLRRGLGKVFLRLFVEYDLLGCLDVFLQDSLSLTFSGRTRRKNCKGQPEPTRNFSQFL